MIQNETRGTVNFREINGSLSGADITVYCNKARALDVFFMKVGDGSYNASGSIIYSGELNFYTHRNCGTWPDLEIHEILHTFGFQHRDDRNSIMYPQQVRCDLGEIDEDIVDKLVEIYGSPEF